MAERDYCRHMNVEATCKQCDAEIRQERDLLAAVREKAEKFEQRFHAKCEAENATLRADLARVTQERDRLAKQHEEADPDSWPPQIHGSAQQAYAMGLMAERDALQAQVMGLVEALQEMHDRAEQSWWKGTPDEAEAQVTALYFIARRAEDYLDKVPADFLAREARRRAREEAAEKLATAAHEEYIHSSPAHRHTLLHRLKAYDALTPEPAPPVREEKNG